MLINVIKNGIKEWRTLSNKEVEFKIENQVYSGQSCAAFNLENNEILLRLDYLENDYYRYIQSGEMLNFNLFLKWVVLHEIGHANDEKIQFYFKVKNKILYRMDDANKVDQIDVLIEKLGNIIIESEMNAWRFARKHIDDSELEIFNTFVSYNVNQYIDFLLLLREKSVEYLYKKMA